MYLVVKLLAGVVFLQPVSQRAVLEGAGDAVLYLYLPQRLRLRDHLHHTWPAGGAVSWQDSQHSNGQSDCALQRINKAQTSASAGGAAPEQDHPHVQTLLDPDLVHDADHLQGQHVLPQVVPRLTQTHAEF